MANPKFSAKRLAIDKANANVVLAVGIAAFIVVFSLVASKALLDQRAYQAKVISKKKIALKQLKENKQEVSKLETAYKAFDESSPNALEGNPDGSGDRDGKNSRLVLDALPSKYNFPGLTTNVEKLLKDNGFVIDAISGSDDEISQAANQTSVTPKPVDMPFSVTVKTAPNTAKSFLQLFDRSIRPMKFQKLEFKVDESNKNLIKITVSAKTYFQPQKNFDVKSEVVK